MVVIFTRGRERGDVFDTVEHPEKLVLVKSPVQGVWVDVREVILAMDGLGLITKVAIDR